MKKWLKKLLGVDALEKNLSNMKDKLFDVQVELSKFKNSQENEGWNLKRDVHHNLESLENKLGWRKVVKQLDKWNKPTEFIELYAHVYVLDKGYRKVCNPFVSMESSGKTEVDKKDWIKNHWDRNYELRCYMVTKLVVPGYFKIEDFLQNDSNNFAIEKMFGKTYKELTSYMEQFNYNKTPILPKKTVDMYELNFYEI